MKTILFTIVVFAMLSCSGQSKVNKIELAKIDSVLNYYFDLMNLEVNKTPINEANRHLYQAINLEADTIYMLKDLSQAESLLIELSGINVPYSDKSEDMVLTPEIMGLWKNWYLENKKKIIWDRKRNMPQLRRK